MKRVAKLLLLVLLFGFSGIRAGIQPVSDAFLQKVMHATFALYGQRTFTDGHKTIRRFVCSATTVQKMPHGYLLLSAGHCVTDTPSDVTYLVSEEIGSPLLPVSSVMARESGPEDISLWYLDTTNKYPAIDFGDESKEHVGDDVVNPNFTSGLVKQLSFGRIASTEIGEGSVRCGGLCEGEFLVDNVANGGASGSAMISLRTHKLIGIDITASDAGTGIEPVSIIKKALTESNMYDKLHIDTDGDSEDQK